MGFGKDNAKKLLWWLGFLGLFLATAWRIADNSFWGDECFTIRLAKLTLPQMLYATAVDVHPPLYYIFVQAAYHLLGNHGYVYHLVSVIPLFITLVLAVTYIRKKFGEVTAVLFAVFSTFMPAAVEYNLEARMYSWTALFVLLAYLEVGKILAGDKITNYLCFAFFSVCAAYCHYYAMVAVAFFYVFLIIRNLFFSRGNIKKTILVCILTVLAYLPWGLKFLLSFKRTADSWWLETAPDMWDCGCFLFGNIVFFVIFLAIIGLLWTNLGKIETKTERVWSYAGGCAAIGLFATGEIASYLIRPLFITRYMYDIAPVVWLLFAFGIAKLLEKFAKKYTVGITAAIFVVFVTAFGSNYYEVVRHERNLDAATTDFLEHVILQDDELILTNSGPHGWTILEYYYPTGRIGETYAMADSLRENGESCTIMSTYIFSGEEIADIKQGGFQLQMIYQGTLGCEGTLVVYKAQKD